MTARFVHDMPFGAALQVDGSVRFHLWAPGVAAVDLVLPDIRESVAMEAAGNGWFVLLTDRATTGTAYAYRLPGGLTVPDPASRSQEQDVHGPSLVINPTAYEWRTATWRGRPWEEAVLYELHVGTASVDGTFDGVLRLLDHLSDTGITALELMPVADFPGRRNWGYDGVLPFAPDRAYGTPEDMKALIDAAHERGLMVFLDVVYNHFGPDGNYLGAYAPKFFTDRHQTPWGAAIDFSVPTVRDFFRHNALYWIEEYRLDGLRFDAVHAIRDDSPQHILDDLAVSVRQVAGNDRQVHLVLENDANESHYLRGDPPSYTAQWNDDFHHAAHVLLTGETDGYYEDYVDDPKAKLARALADGFVYQGEPSPHRGGARRGDPSGDLSPVRFVDFLQNHDQVGNRAFGGRLVAEFDNKDALRAAMAVLLLSPAIPMLFMGEEIGSRAPFAFFCDFEGDLARAVRDGRRREFSRFAAFADPAAQARIPDPNAGEVFIQARPFPEGPLSDDQEAWRDYVRRLLAIRAADIAPLIRRPFHQATTGFAGEAPLSVEWLFGGNTALGLIFNPSDRPCEAVADKDRRIVFASHSGLDAGGAVAMPPWSVLWSVRPG